MKRIQIFTSIALLLFLSTPLVAQTNQPPDRGLLEAMLTALEECNQLAAYLTYGIKVMEDNPGEFTLAQYNKGKESLERVKSCVNSLRRNLSDLKKDYQGWFNNPGTSVTIRWMHLTSITPLELQALFDDLGAKMANALDRFAALQEPEH